MPGKGYLLSYYKVMVAQLPNYDKGTLFGVGCFIRETIYKQKKVKRYLLSHQEVHSGPATPVTSSQLPPHGRLDLEVHWV